MTDTQKAIEALEELEMYSDSNKQQQPLFDEAIETIRRALKLAEAVEWQDIVSAPRDGRHIVIFNPDTDEPEVAWYGGKKKVWPWKTRNSGYKEDWPAHWMPLPAAPESHTAKAVE